MSTINFGIDLGTTNSVIAKYENGKVEIFKNPVGHKETLPSVVAFRKDRIIVGDKAREYIEKDPENVVGSFKRKMGTTESFLIPNIQDTKTPVELSALVLKELKNFVYTGERVDASVITIPASFDTIQSNATKKAGYAAGYEEVLLLQEPIAASLAYANHTGEAEKAEGQWLVYDLGGGTFDVALVRIQDGEMKVVDHQGDNFLGGLDFDMLIIDQIVVPHLEATGRFDDLQRELRSAKGKYNRLYYRLLLRAEEVKVQLSGNETAEIEFEIDDRDDETMEVLLTISRAQFEHIIREKIEGTVLMIRQMLERNMLEPQKLKYILMIGGSTYIPLVRKMTGEALDIPVNCGIDPTTAVAVGAAYYAGTRSRSRKAETPATERGTSSDIRIRTAYQKTSQDTEEYFAAAVEGNFQNSFYRITRDDGGFDSGLKPLQDRISEYLPVAKGMYNSFTLKVYDAANNLLNVDVPAIGITQGKFNVIGQPLPNDICLEIDDIERNVTKLDVMFEKNAILPLRKTITKTIMKTIRKNSDDSVIINVVEGARYTSPGTNPSIGVIRISGKTLTRDLVKGSDIEITLDISESRDLRITTYLVMTDQEFTNLFSPSERHVDILRLRDDSHELLKTLNAEVNTAESHEDYEKAGKLSAIRDEMYLLHEELKKLSDDDVTDRKYQIEDRKRKLAQETEVLTVENHMASALFDLLWMKRLVRSIVDSDGTPDEKQRFEQLLAKEKNVVATSSPLRVREYHDEISRFGGPIQWRSQEHIIGLFHYYAYEREDHSDPKRAKQISELGEKALERKNYDEVRVCIRQLRALLPDDEEKPKDLKGTGIG